MDSDGKEIIGTRVLGKAYCVPDTGKHGFLFEGRRRLSSAISH